MTTGIYIMLIFFSPDIGSAAVEKIGIYESRELCVKAAEDAGFLPTSRVKGMKIEYSCVFSQDNYGIE